MSQSWPKPGVGLVGEYQVSGHILPINSTGPHNLNYVASSITATEAGTITFYDSANNSVALTVDAGVRIVAKFVKFNNTSDVAVELTNIEAARYSSPLFANLKS